MSPAPDRRCSYCSMYSSVKATVSERNVFEIEHVWVKEEGAAVRGRGLPLKYTEHGIKLYYLQAVPWLHQAIAVLDLHAALDRIVWQLQVLMLDGLRRSRVLCTHKPIGKRCVLKSEPNHPKSPWARCMGMRSPSEASPMLARRDPRLRLSTCPDPSSRRVAARKGMAAGGPSARRRRAGCGEAVRIPTCPAA